MQNSTTENNDPPSSISHDLKSPLTGIQMMVHLLLEKNVGPLNEKQEMMLNSVKTDIDKLTAAINHHFPDDQ